MRAIGIVPARGGSKGIPRKNIRPLGGRPLIHYTLEAGINARRVERLVVSSDDDEILELARAWPGVMAVRRPPELARDDSPVVPALLHVLDTLAGEGIDGFDAVVVLQPTSPLRRPEHIDEALELLAGSDDAQAVISVTAMYDMHPARMYWRREDGRLDPVMAEYEQTRRQDIPPAYYRNGSIYAVRTAALRREKTVMVKPALGYVIPDRFLLNIDEPRDWLVAEALMAQIHDQ